MRWIALGGVLCGLLWAGCDSKPPAKDGDTAKNPPAATTPEKTPANPPTGNAPAGAMMDGEIKITGMT